MPQHPYLYIPPTLCLSSTNRRNSRSTSWSMPPHEVSTSMVSCVLMSVRHPQVVGMQRLPRYGLVKAVTCPLTAAYMEPPSIPALERWFSPSVRTPGFRLGVSAFSPARYMVASPRRTRHVVAYIILETTCL
jgi:hypothetical protein